jgi:hypothetical protein
MFENTFGKPKKNLSELDHGVIMGLPIHSAGLAPLKRSAAEVSALATAQKGFLPNDRW